MKRLAPLAALCVLSSLAGAQGLATIRGTVTNEAGRPLEQAQVTLDPQGSTGRCARTPTAATALGESRPEFILSGRSGWDSRPKPGRSTSFPAR